MDYYKCENCGKVFDEFEMNYRAAQVDKKCWCRACRGVAQHNVQGTNAPARNYIYTPGVGHYKNCPVCVGECVCP